MTIGLAPGIRDLLLCVLLVASCIWIGGWFALIVLARSATATLTREGRVALFRHLGRRYGMLSTTALVIGLIAGAVLLLSAEWTPLSTCIVVVSGLVLVVLGAGVVQARRLTRMRRAMNATPGDAGLAQRVARDARAALVLRAAIGVLSLVVLVLAVVHTG